MVFLETRINVSFQMNLFTKQKQTHRLRESTDGYRGSAWGEGIARKFGISM